MTTCRPEEFGMPPAFPDGVRQEESERTRTFLVERVTLSLSRDDNG